jgi:hypothetical protein
MSRAGFPFKPECAGFSLIAIAWFYSLRLALRLPVFPESSAIVYKEIALELRLTPPRFQNTI